MLIDFVHTKCLESPIHKSSPLLSSPLLGPFNNDATFIPSAHTIRGRGRTNTAAIETLVGSEAGSRQSSSLDVGPPLRCGFNPNSFS